MAVEKTVSVRIPADSAWRDKNRELSNSSDTLGLLRKSLVAEFHLGRPRTMKTVSRIIPAANASRAKNVSSEFPPQIKDGNENRRRENSSRRNEHDENR